MRFRVRKEIGLKDMGYRREWYWGIAYYEYDRLAIVAYIIPLNWIVWLVREIYFRLRNTPEGVVDRAYRKGWKNGWEVREREYQSHQCKPEILTQDDFDNMCKEFRDNTKYK